MTGGPLSTRISPAALTVGAPLVVHLSGVLPPGATLVGGVPQARDTLPEGFRILSADSLRIHDGLVEAQIRVAFFRPDSQAVPSFAVAYHTASGTDTLVSTPIPVLVHSVLPVANATLRDIRDVDAPWPVTSIGIALGVLVVGLLGIRAFRRARRVAPQAHAHIEPGPSAYDLALEQLRDIEHSDLAVEQRYAKAADVVRAYIAATRGVPALERTTTEILSALNVNGEVAEFFNEADLVKFAGWRPHTYAAQPKRVIDALR